LNEIRPTPAIVVKQNKVKVNSKTLKTLLTRAITDYDEYTPYHCFVKINKANYRKSIICT